jgi:hypothetical protein
MHPRPSHEDYNGEREPMYVAERYRGPESGNIGFLLDAIDRERFDVSTWREFRTHTAYWPFFSIAFHVICRVLLLAGVIAFIYLKMEREWTGVRLVMFAAVGVLALITLMIVGEEYTRKIDWERYRPRSR